MQTMESVMMHVVRNKGRQQKGKKGGKRKTRVRGKVFRKMVEPLRSR